MNFLVFNNTAKKLSATIYGVNGADHLPVAVDSGGKLLLSSQGAVEVTATDLDIRNLSDTTDSVRVSATDLDIRALAASIDSVAIGKMGFAELSVTGTVGTTTVYALTTNISAYSENSFFVMNAGGATMTMTVQIAPVDSAGYYIASSTNSVTTSTPVVAAITVPMKFARIALVSSGGATYIAYYNGRA